MHVSHIFISAIDICKMSILYFKDHQLPRYILTALIFLLAGLLYKTLNIKSQSTSRDVFTPKDINKIAGEDILSTQLDLAKAYIEMGQKSLAKPILKQVIKKSRGKDRYDLRQLLKSL